METNERTNERGGPVRKWDRGIRTKPDDSRTGRKKKKKKTILCISRPRLHSDTDKCSDFVRTGLSKKIGSHWSRGPWNWKDVPTLPAAMKNWLEGYIYIYTHKTVYRITYLVLDCHRGPFPVIPAGQTLRKTKPNKLLTIHPSKHSSCFRGLNTERWNGGISSSQPAETDRVSLTPLNVLLSLSYRDQSRDGIEHLISK